MKPNTFQNLLLDQIERINTFKEGGNDIIDFINDVNQEINYYENNIR